MDNDQWNIVPVLSQEGCKFVTTRIVVFIDSGGVQISKQELHDVCAF